MENKIAVIIPAYKEKQPLRDVEEVYNQIMEQKN